MTYTLRNAWKQSRRYWASSLVMVIGAAIGTAVAVFTLGTSLDRTLRSVALTPSDASQTHSLAIRNPGRIDAQALFTAAQEIQGLTSLEIDEPFTLGPAEGRSGTAYTVARPGDSWHPPLIAGRYIDSRDSQPGAEPVIVIGKSLADDWFGPEPAVGTTIELRVQGRPIAFRVAGVVGVRNGYTTWDDRIVLPGHLDGGRRVRLFTIKVALGTDLNVIRGALSSSLGRQGIPDVELVNAPPTTVALSDEAKVAAGAFVMSVVVLVVAGINCGNLALFWAWRRRREMGIRQALGASPRRVVWMAMSEVLLLNLTGAVLGLCVYAAIRQWTSLGGLMPFHLTHIAVGVGAGCISGLFAAVGPAIYIARLEPSSAIKLGV